MIAVCKRVPAYTPQSFHEDASALLVYPCGDYFGAHHWDSFNPGRLDQHLWPFYQETAAGSLSKRAGKRIVTGADQIQPIIRLRQKLA